METITNLLKTSSKSIKLLKNVINDGDNVPDDNELVRWVER